MPLGKIKKKIKSTRLAVRVTQEMKIQIWAVAERQGMTPSQIVEMCLAERLPELLDPSAPKIQVRFVPSPDKQKRSGEKSRE
ncbi:MAG TPA: hypothetical protein VHB20_03875 [Verrucomicrobiae bacterium]|nr:hypothetical protein [Verrucomicrobiae bacterium]